MNKPLTAEDFRDADWDRTQHQLATMQHLLDSLDRVVPIFTVGEGVRYRGKTGHVVHRRECPCEREKCSGILYTVRFDHEGGFHPKVAHHHYLEHTDLERCPEADAPDGKPIIDFPQIYVDGREHWHYYLLSHNAWAIHGHPLMGYRFNSSWDGGSIAHQQVFGRLFKALVMAGDYTFTRHGIDLERNNQPPPR